MASIPLVAPRPSNIRAAGRELPPLEAGDHLDQKTFHERYEAMPEGFRAELIGGIVIVPSPLRLTHGEIDHFVVCWLGAYRRETGGVRSFVDVTAILGPESEPQPDSCLLIDPESGGQARRTPDDYLEGAPELIVEVASSTESIDMHRKRRDYERAGVREYVVVLVRRQRVVWFVLREGAFVELPAGPDGIYRSEVFPGLWLDPAALLRMDGNRVDEVVRQGLATPEHQAFIAKLVAARGDKH